MKSIEEILEEIKKHTEECKQQQLAHFLQREEYYAQWPKACRRCGVTGVLHEGLAAVCECSEDVDEHGDFFLRCPRCTSRSVYKDGSFCRTCGWAYRKKETHEPKLYTQCACIQE